MKRKIVSILLILIFIFSLPCVQADASSVFARQKKSIFLVMDDSSSMGGNYTLDANYSLQTLIAMTDKNDAVKLYFLNNDGKSIGDIRMEKKSNATIERIKLNYPSASGGTPYDPVRIAQQELKSAASKGDKTDYWLVVFTDGQFNDVDVNADLRAFAQETLSNGTHPNVLFLTTDSGKYVSDSGIANLHSVQMPSVIDVMNEAVRVISGRIKADVTYSQDNTQLSFNMPYPAMNIIVFTQNNKVQVENYTAPATLDTSENYIVSYPGKGNITDSTVCFIVEENGSSISNGDITLTFNKPLNTKDTVVLFEPAIGITAHYYNEDGQEITDADLYVGSKIRVKYNLCDSSTKQELPDSLFKGNVSYSSEVNGQKFNTNDFEFEITTEDVNMTLNATLPDGYVLTAENSYQKLPVKRIISFTLNNGGNFYSEYSKLKEAEPIIATVLINGNIPSESQFKDFSLSIKGENVLFSNFSIIKDKNENNFKIKPEAGWISPLTPKQKSYEVVLTDKDGSTYTATMNVEIPGQRSWLPFIMFLLGLYIVFVLLTKKYFRFGARFTVWSRILPRTDNQPCYERRCIWKLYLYEIGALFSFKSWSGLIHFLEFFFVPFGRQKVTMHKIGRENFSNITLCATEGLFNRNGGGLMLKDKTMQYVNDKIVSRYSIIRSNRRTVVDFKSLILKGMIPFDDGESLFTYANNQNWYITYTK